MIGLAFFMIIKFHNISKSFGEKKVLSSLNLEIEEGEIFGILGPSGSGKSTLIQVLLGTLKPDHGKVFFMDEDITGQPDKLKKIMGLTTQENAFYEKLTVLENMQYYANLYGVKPDIRKIASSVKLDSSLNTLASRISGGMKRRLDFAISLLHDPKLLILDEPTTGLDPNLVIQFWEIVRRIRDEGKTVIVISHIFDEIKENCKRAGILYKGDIHTFKIDKHTDMMKKFREVVI